MCVDIDRVNLNTFKGTGPFREVDGIYSTVYENGIVKSICTVPYCTVLYWYSRLIAHPTKVSTVLYWHSRLMAQPTKVCTALYCTGTVDSWHSHKSMYYCTVLVQ